MSKTQTVHRPSTSTLWPWVVGAFLLGFAVSILIPPLLLLLIVALSTWGLVRWGHQTPSSRIAIAVDLGLGLATVLFLVIWIVGNISR
jgi:energy-coupling factor transporter transmembrane protein EcfT